MTPEQQRAGALEAIERIVNRGGDDDEVLNAVLGVVGKLDPDAADDPAFAARVDDAGLRLRTDPASCERPRTRVCPQHPGAAASSEPPPLLSLYSGRARSLSLDSGTSPDRGMSPSNEGFVEPPNVARERP